MAVPNAEIIGVDINPQARYPFNFVQADALTYPLCGFDFIWASPPCQRYSRMSQSRKGLSQTYPDLIGPMRSRLVGQPSPYVIENVPESPLINPFMLCGH